ncbi:hypothetical protein GCM10009633_23940 [Janibacter melonis]|uniref:YegP family protein n=1 Tax=Janibacter melonis TaxID=262209 RepID=UPI003370E8C1|nr:YegP family protein [Janibacter melonis]
MAGVEYQLCKGTSDQPYWWRVVSLANRQVLATSETYYNRQDAISAAQLVRASSKDASFKDYTGDKK